MTDEDLDNDAYWNYMKWYNPLWFWAEEIQ